MAHHIQGTIISIYSALRWLFQIATNSRFFAFCRDPIDGTHWTNIWGWNFIDAILVLVPFVPSIRGPLYRGIPRVNMPQRPSACQNGCSRQYAKQDCLRQHAKRVVPVDMPNKFVPVNMPKEYPSMCQHDAVRQHAKNLCPSKCQNNVL